MRRPTTVSFRRVLQGLGFALLLGTSPVAAEDPGPAVGDSAPGFSLVDQNGVRRDLASLLPKGDGKLAVVFYRSADW